MVVESAYPHPEEEVDAKKGTRREHKQDVLAQTLPVICIDLLLAAYPKLFVAFGRHAEHALQSTDRCGCSQAEECRAVYLLTDVSIDTQQLV